MRKINVPLFLVILCGFVAASCGNSAEKVENAGEASGDAAMTVAAANKFLDADTANKGKQITVTAYSWGTQNRMEGEVGLMLGDKKLEGFQQASFVCIFPKEQEAKVKSIAKDAKVTVTGKISKGSGGTELNECMIKE